ncbi:tolB amino-terminal domain protein [Francisella frigiditurris]|uniref:TolB amino-terminal domain protein n=1 Tax=Francisella frigiditurris TaxID=1542390 RepID=A0A1J0KUM2_9GAMM|nr:tolB amino-terminal domain protein [Francisella frigiditurris]
MIRKILGIFTIFIFLSTSSYADLTAEVTSGVIQKPLVTVVSNNIVDDFSQGVNSVITADLNNNGAMEANDDIKYEIKSSHDVPWKDINSDYVVLTNYKKNSSDNFSVEVIILKRNDTSYIRSVSYNGISTSLERVLAHKIANYAYKAITGDEGFFLTKLAYVKVTNPYSRYGRVYELVVSDYDGNNKHTILRQTDNPIATPSWSHDGKFIIYSSYVGGSMGIYTIELATGKVREIAKFKGINSAPSFSPDDKSIVLALSKGYSEQTNIYVMNLANKDLKQLTINGINTAPQFSPNGSTVVFTSDRGGKPNIYMAAVNSKYPQSSLVTTRTYQAFDPNYTPDAKNLVFMYQKGRGEGTQIAKLNLANNSIDVLTKGKADASPTVSPYGDMAAYISTNSRGYTSLSMVSLDGEKQFSVDSSNDAKTLLQSPSWSPKNF